MNEQGLIKKSQLSLARKLEAFALLLIAFVCTSYCSAWGESSKIEAPTAAKTPTLVLIHSRECPVCTRVRPIIQELGAAYAPRVKLVLLDVTDDNTKKEAKATAKSLGLAAFFNLYSDTFPCVGIFDSSNHTVRELCGFNSRAKYETYIKKALEKSGT